MSKKYSSKEIAAFSFTFLDFYRTLRYQHDLVQFLLNKSFAEHETATSIGKHQPIALDPAGTVSFPGLEQWEVLTIADDIDKSFIAANVLAGSASIVLDEVAQSLMVRLGLSKNNANLDLGPPVNEVPITTLLWATGNNFRHYRSWQRKPRPYSNDVRQHRLHKRAFESIDPLAHFLGSDNRLPYCVAAEVMGKLCGGVYDSLEQLLLQIPPSIADRHGFEFDVARSIALEWFQNMMKASTPSTKPR